MALTRKHFEGIASAIGKVAAGETDRERLATAVSEFGRLLEAENPRFDFVRFAGAVTESYTAATDHKYATVSVLEGGAV